MFASPLPPARPTSGLMPNRRASGIHPVGRRRLQTERDDLLVTLGRIDREMVALHHRRVALTDELGQLRDRLWPIVPEQHGRRPTALDHPTLRPQVSAA